MSQKAWKYLKFLLILGSFFAFCMLFQYDSEIDTDSGIFQYADLVVYHHDIGSAAVCQRL